MNPKNNPDPLIAEITSAVPRQRIPGSWEVPADDELNMALVPETWQDLRQFSTGSSYINFQSADEGLSRIESSFGENLGRLSGIKARWDPLNVFRINRNIIPATESKLYK